MLRLHLSSIHLATVTLGLCFGVARAQDSVPDTPPWQSASSWPDRVIVTLDDDPRSSFAVSWRTAAEVTATRAEIVLAEPHSRFDIGARSVAATSQIVDLGAKVVDGTTHPLRWNTALEPVAYHTVQFTGLAPDTLYAYRVMGAEDHWSEWTQTRTAPDGNERFRFLYLGDAQDGLTSHWARVMRAAFAAAPDARFAIHAGDLVNWGSRDYEWAGWFKSVGFIHGMIPALPIVGNHEYYDGIVNAEDRSSINALSILWQPQFALPHDPSLPAALAETVYTVRYGDALFVMLNTMADTHFEFQAAWLDRVLGESDAKWKIVTTHHPMFEMLDRRNVPGLPDTGPERRRLWLPVLQAHGVDLVLQGHDHSYGRGYTPMAAAGRAQQRRRRPAGMVFVSTSSGAKMYDVAENAWSDFDEFGATLQRSAENTQLFQVVEIDGDSLTFASHTPDGRVYDAFRIDKQSRGVNRIVDLPNDFPIERSFENTPAYENGRYDVEPTRAVSGAD